MKVSRMNQLYQGIIRRMNSRGMIVFENTAFVIHKH